MKHSDYSELLIGCGNSRKKFMRIPDRPEGWQNVTTLDIDPACGADVIHDLNVLPYPFTDESFDEIWASEVLEHFGVQGDWRGFFAQFSELHRILRPDGLIIASVPAHYSEWAWGDPGHTRVITRGTLAFLSQDEYRAQVGVTRMTDYRDCWKGDLRTEHVQFSGESMYFVLRKHCE